MIVGLQNRLDDHIGYVEQIGQTHLQENEFFSKGKYDNMDVVCFDKNKFVHDLHKNDVEDTVI